MLLYEMNTVDTAKVGVLYSTDGSSILNVENRVITVNPEKDSYRFRFKVKVKASHTRY